MTMSVAVSYLPQNWQWEDKIVRRITIAWTSAADGTASGLFNINGKLIKAVTNPTDSPTDNYDITLVDENGVDIAESLLANRDVTNTEEQYIYKEVTLGGTGTDRAARDVYHAGSCTFTIANAGSGKSGVCVLYVI